MNFRRRDPVEQPSERRVAPEETQAPNAAAEGAAFLAAADEAIARIMSGDAESFLRANRQQGGQ